MSTFFRRDGSVNAASGPALTGVQVFVCNQPVTSAQGVIPPAPLATIYSDNAGANPIVQPILTDGLGNFFFYAATGIYTIIFFDPLGRIPLSTFPDQNVTSPGGGSVTSVALKGDGILFTTSISGSPINSSGTLDLSLSEVNFSANTFPAGPASGPAAPLAPRKLVSADFPAGVGTVSSVAVAISGSALLSLVSSGGPITSSGTVTLTINFANQPANTFLAGPASGGSGAVTARRPVAADIFGAVAVSASATPVFDASLFASPMFTMTLTLNVTGPTVTNPTTGQEINFILTQDGTGGRTFTWPANFHGASNVDGGANAVSVQSFRFDGSFWRATGPGSVNAT